MKVLYLCHRIPYPPDKGEKIRAFHQLQALGERHEVDLYTLADDPADLQHQSALRRYCNHVTAVPLNPRFARLRTIPYLLTRKPLTVPYFHSRGLRRAILAAVSTRSYDRIFVYCSAMAQYVETGWGIPVITDFVDVDSNKWEQYSTYAGWPLSIVYRREAWALRKFEQRICQQSARVLVTTDREAALVRQLSDNARVDVLPNGVDTEYFKPSEDTAERAAPTVGFTGDMSYFPNVEAVTYFARNVLPLVRQSLPDTRFLIVGRNPSPKVKALAEVAGIEITGFVPDVRKHLARMQIAVAPFSIAAGIQNKILEAMACGIPVVCTSRAAQGLSSKTSSAVEIADGAGDMAAKIVRLLRDPKLAFERAREGRARVTTDYQWSQSKARLLELLEEPAGRQPAKHVPARQP